MMRVQKYSIKNQCWENIIEASEIRIVTERGCFMKVAESSDQGFELRTPQRMWLNPKGDNAIHLDTLPGE